MAVKVSRDHEEVLKWEFLGLKIEYENGYEGSCILNTYQNLVKIETVGDREGFRSHPSANLPALIATKNRLDLDNGITQGVLRQ